MGGMWCYSQRRSSLRHQLTKPRCVRPCCQCRRPHFVWCGAQGQLQIVTKSRVQPSHGPAETLHSTHAQAYHLAGFGRLVMCKSVPTHTCRPVRHPKVGCVAGACCWSRGSWGMRGPTTPTTTPNRANDATEVSWLQSPRKGQHIWTPSVT